MRERASGLRDILLAFSLAPSAAALFLFSLSAQRANELCCCVTQPLRALSHSAKKKISSSNRASGAVGFHESCGEGCDVRKN